MIEEILKEGTTPLIYVSKEELVDAVVERIAPLVEQCLTEAVRSMFLYQVMTPAKLAEMLGTSVYTVRRHINDGSYGEAVKRSVGNMLLVNLSKMPML